MKNPDVNSPMMSSLLDGEQCMCSGMACLPWKRASDVPSEPFVALSILSCTYRRLVLYVFGRDGWNPPPRLKCTTRLNEALHHQSASPDATQQEQRTQQHRGCGQCH